MIIATTSSTKKDTAHQSIGDVAFQTVAKHLREETGIILTDAKKGLAVSRLSRRLRILGLDCFEDYCDVLSGPEGDAELQEMIALLTTNVTRFFREPHHFEALRKIVLPPLMAKARKGEPVRIWSAGCSSGEEPYSIAMTILKDFPDAASLDIRILATDIDKNVIHQGSVGRYKLIATDFSENPYLSGGLNAVSGQNDCYEIVSDVKKIVSFGQLNLQHTWPMQGKFDVIFCRNVVIYFSTDTQQNLWPRFASILADGGYLMIGHSERVTGPATELLQSAGITNYKLKPNEVSQ